MELVEFLSHWKELGALGTGVFLLYKLLDKFFAWLLEVLGIRIKRGQSREDQHDADMKQLRADMDKMKVDMAQLRSAVSAGYEVAKGAADGIETEITEAEAGPRDLDSERIKFFVKQLRTIKPLAQLS